MRAVKLIGCWLVAAHVPLSVQAASTAAVPGERELRQECSALPQAGMRDCLVKKAKSSQLLLEKAEDRATHMLSQWDEDQKYVSQAKARLAVSSKDFSKSRDTQCEFLASLTGGGAGNAHEMRRLACVSELNDRRARQLDDAVSDLPVK